VGGSSTLGGLTDVTVSAPSAWHVQGYDADAGVWKNTSHIHGNLAGGIYIHIKNTDSVQLDKGTPFYITGTVGASDQVEVQAADSADPLKGPAVGLVEEDLAVNGEGNGVIIGEIFQFDTATPSWSTNDALYVANTGGLTNVQPTSGYRQIVAYVGRVHASTGTLVLTGASVDPVAGSNGQVQFNDNGGFGGDTGLTFNKTTNALTVGASTVDGGSAKVYGDINLDDGGTFSTTVQSVTPTANRTISFPDATGTVALVSGANGTIQYNDAGTLKGNSDFTVDLDWNNASTVFTGLKLNVTDGAGGSPVGNSDSNLIDVQTGGTSVLRARTNGSILFLAGGYLYASNSIVARYINTDWQINRLALPATGLSDTFLERDDANILAQRNGTASQTFRLYNTWGNNGVDFERLNIRWTGTNSLRIETEAGGTGTARALDLISGSSLLGLGAGAGVRWYVTNNSQFAAASDACTINFGATSDTGFARDSAGVVAITDGSTGTGYVKQTPVLVSALPTAATVGAGTRGFVSDATATTFASVVTGSGTASTAGTVPVYSDGTDWRIG